ncbi:MAG: hypothetical protein V8T48_10855 [Oscillospiraceae bacterium]
MSSVSRRTPVDFLLRIENAPAEAGAGMKSHHGVFQQVFHIAAENAGQLVEDVCLRLVNCCKTFAAVGMRRKKTQGCFKRVIKQRHTAAVPTFYERRKRLWKKS